MEYFLTSIIMEKLGVSRNWVNTHLRHLGTVQQIEGKGILGIRAVVYWSDEVIEWINENATFERQTIYVPYSIFGMVTDEEAEMEIEQIYSITDPDPVVQLDMAKAAWDKFYEKAIPQNILKAEEELGSWSQKRKAKWCPVSHQITKLAQLRSAKSILEEINPYSSSLELAYREIYKRGMIKATIKGRVWYLEPCEEWDKTKGLFPYEILKKHGYV